jgi:hypothetical protein
MGYLPFVVRFMVRQLESLSVACADPELPPLRVAPLGCNLYDFHPPVFPGQGNRFIRISEPGVAFDQFTHIGEPTCKKSFPSFR